MIREMDPGADILASAADVLVCPVNCQAGVMGKGLAKAFAVKWPFLKIEHRHACEVGKIPGGLAYVSLSYNLLQSQCVCLFPTKHDWRMPSRLDWVSGGLERLSRTLEWGLRYRSVATPALGCGLGGLPWSEVRPLILATAEKFPEIEWEIYPPGEPSA